MPHFETSIGADSGIDHNDVNRAFGKIAPGLRDGECALLDVEGGDFVCHIGDLHARRDAQNDALHGADEMVRGSKIGG